MPYVSRHLFTRALEALAGRHPLLLFSIPCMTRLEIPTHATPAEAEADPHRYGGSQEKSLLDEYYRVDGAPGSGAYFSPSAGDWVADRYAETSLQRQRKDKAKPTSTQLFFETGGRGNRGYAFKAGFAQVGANDPVFLPQGPVSLLALGAWLYRHEEIESIAAIPQRVIEEFKLDRDGLVGTLYDDSSEAINTGGGLSDTPLSPEAVIELLGTSPPPPPPPTLGSMAEIVERIEQAMERTGVALAAGVVGQVIRAWLVREIVVLVGAPGTGKTTFAKRFADACEIAFPDFRPKQEVLVDPEFDSARLLGYLNLAGEFKATSFTQSVLGTFNAKLPQVVLLEEWNTAQVEGYLGQILHAIESEGGIELPDGSQPPLPLDTLFIATCNSVRDEPETRLPVSRPTKRRTTVIEMPNILYDAWESGGRDALIEQTNIYLRYKRETIEEREEQAPLLDELRASLLDQTPSIETLDDLSRDTLLDVVEFLFDTTEGRQFMTVGLLIDVVETLVYAGEDAAEALSAAIRGKLLEQVTTVAVARGIAERASALPGAEGIARAVDGMDFQDGTVNHLL